MRTRLIGPLAVALIVLGGVVGVAIGSCMSRGPSSVRVSGAPTIVPTAVAEAATDVDVAVAEESMAATVDSVAAAADGPATTEPTAVGRSLVATLVPMGEATVAELIEPSATPTTAPTEVPVEELTAVTVAAATSTAQPEEERTAPETAAVAVDPALLSSAAAETIARYQAAVVGTVDVPILFVSRQITPRGTVYWDQAKGMPGAGPFSRFEVATPGRLLVLEPNGTIRILIDGANPTPTSLNLIDVNAPAVSYDGQKILFSGLPAGDYEPGYMTNPGAWRIYQINIDGSGLQQLTFADQDDLDLAQFGALADIFKQYDDTDPVYLPDGRIVFSSTRWPAFGQYGGSRTSNLFVMNADGSNLHRITSERNGADRPLVDPLTGQIIYSRWWRNFRVPTNDMSTVASDSFGGYHQQAGLLALTDSTESDPVPGGTANVGRNAWHLGVINPDGSGLKLFTGGSGLFLLGEDSNHAYGGVFAPDGTLYANYYPMKNMTEASGFGGIRRYQRGVYSYDSIVGVTGEGQYPVVAEKPDAFGVNANPYATDPVVLPDGRLVYSWAADYRQDYGLYVANADGSNQQPLLDIPGLTELRAQAVMARPVPPVIADTVTAVAPALPPAGESARESDGAFVFNALNVYFNAPVDVDIISGVPVGQAGSIRFYMDHQRQQPGSLDWVDWPILLNEVPIQPDGSVVAQLPANLPLFEQIRSPQPDYAVPMTGRGVRENPGVAHVLGHNFGRPGDVANCVGCHAGHTLIEVPENPEDAKWTNLAPGAEVLVSSVHPLIGGNVEGLVDRRVQKGRIISYWRSDPAQSATSQWVELHFPVPVTVRTVRLYNPRSDSPDVSTIQVTSARVRLFGDSAGTAEVAQADVGVLAEAGTDVAFADVTSRVVRVEVTGVTGVFEGEAVASLAEIEVIARAEAPTGGVLAQAGQQN